MPFNYYKTEIETGNNVFFKLLDKNGINIEEMDYVCFSPLTYGKIPENTDIILIIRKKNLIPYDYSIQKRWISELNKLGFPCYINPENGENIEFLLKLKDFKYKSHLTSTLQLLRCLWETYICYIPELYFTEIKGLKLNLDKKFLILQDVHKKIKKLDYSSFANTNHMVTSYRNKFNIDRKTLFKRIKDSKFGIYGEKCISIENMWKGIPIISKKTNENLKVDINKKSNIVIY